MNEKRFTYDYNEHNGNLFDNKYDTFYPIKDSEENIELLCKRLNSIVDENKKLKSDDTIAARECKIAKLKDDSNYYQIKIGECEEELLFLRSENKQLKSQLSEQGIQSDYLLSENQHMQRVLEENKQFKYENKRMTDKLNQLALEFLEYDMVTMGKATEISEMCYLDFLKYRKENGNPMELQL